MCLNTVDSGRAGFSPSLRVAQAEKSVPPTQASEYAHVTRLAVTLGNLLIGKAKTYLNKEGSVKEAEPVLYKLDINS